MKLLDLLKQTSLDSALRRMYEVWPDEKKSEEGYREVYQHLLVMPWQRSDELDFIDVRKVKDWFDGHEYPHVNGCKMGDETTWAIEYVPWAEWLALEVRSDYDADATLAAILYEMTWAGFDQQKIAEQKEHIMDLKDEVDEIVEGGDEQAIKEGRLIEWDPTKDS